MSSQTDWSLIWPIASAVVAFGIVYSVSLASNIPAETVLLRSTGALLMVGLPALIIRAIVGARQPEPPKTSGTTIDITLPEDDPYAPDADVPEDENDTNDTAA